MYAPRRPLLATLVAFSLLGCRPSGADESEAPSDTFDTSAAAPERVDWVEIAGGSFVMGSEPSNWEWPAHTVEVPDFAIMRTEVTAADYVACHEDGGCVELPSSEQCFWADSAASDRALTCVNWFQAVAFCEWAGGRLPTESEWEFAARSRGLDREFPWGEQEPSCDYAVIDIPAGVGCGYGSANPPCTRPAGNTEQGLCDMAGNVFEWVQDRMNWDYQGAPVDGSAWETGLEFRVMRGGAVGSEQSLRTRERTYHPDDFYYGGMGVRCAQSR